jgi:3-oxoacyl-[acyl-carrier protein] reductase
MRFEGKTALITGGSRGIGRACVVRLVAEGATVAFLYQKNSEAADKLVAELAVPAERLRGIQADVRDLSRAHQVVDALVEEWGHLDVLVNSAGIVRDGLLGGMTEQQWREVLDTNLGGTYNYCRAVTQPMMMARRGSVVNLSSTASQFAARGQVNYAASKGAIDSLTRAMAKELAVRKVRVNAVAPGLIATDMSDVVRSLAGDKLKEIMPMKRIGNPEEVASVIAFLASDEASYVTGQIIRVDGGLSLGGY